MNLARILAATTMVMASLTSSAGASDRMGDRYSWGDSTATSTILHAIDVERVFDAMERSRYNVPLKFRGLNSPEFSRHPRVS